MTPSPPSQGRLHLVLQPTFEEGVRQPDFLWETPLIRFVAYGGEHRVSGWVRLKRIDSLTC